LPLGNQATSQAQKNQNASNQIMPTAIYIREASNNDIATIRDIATITWPDAYGTYISMAQLNYMLDMMYSDDSLQDQMNKGHQFYIAELDGEAIGFASVSKEANNTCKLNKLYVLPTSQKTGAGKALLFKTIDFATSVAANCLYLQVNKQNNAQHFYSKHGFTIREAAVLDIGGGFVMDDYIMELVFKY
jgi:N-acetylglutamate synthase-like GNAT family acetyltransferase